ncbi:unnamed protein product [Microthlaspi erraticum]|uniref:Uncharacterized protein n=1 Tax=Microthlaspi erraticum TaxID=1685480 RepID=A0A6D2KQT8_9BRAS|nr:unnamed protein product [Microthlaspi erraticum]
MKLKEFNAKVKSLPLYISSEEAWNNHDLVNLFFSTGETKEDINQLFRQARLSLSSHAANQPPSPPPSPRPKWYRNSISREKLAEFNQFVKTFVKKSLAQLLISTVSFQITCYNEASAPAADKPRVGSGSSISGEKDSSYFFCSHMVLLEVTLLVQNVYS